MPGALIGQVVTIYRRDDAVPQVHGLYRSCNFYRFVVVGRQRLSCSSSAEAAGARTAVAQDHERCRSVLPAVPFVGAFSAGAYRMQSMPFDGFFYETVLLSAFDFCVEPARFSQWSRLLCQLFFHLCKGRECPCFFKTEYYFFAWQTVCRGIKLYLCVVLRKRIYSKLYEQTLCKTSIITRSSAACCPNGGCPTTRHGADRRP